jgi:acetyl-CoA synthetase
MQKPGIPGNTVLRDDRADIYSRSLEDFWDDEGRRRVAWFRPYRQLYQWDLPYAKWFLGGLTNACFNCVDRHVDDGHGAKVAFFWEGEPDGDRRTLTFAELQDEVVRLANGLRQLGVRKGTKVGIYMGMVPELPMAMLACGRIGAPHVVVSAEADAGSVAQQLNGTGCTILITQDEAWSHGRTMPIKKVADQAMSACATIANCIVLRRTGGAVSMTHQRDLWWQHVTAGMSADPRSCPCEPMDSEDLLFVTFPNDGAGPPRGVMHTTAGYLVGTATTHDYVFDVKDDTVYWCTGDIGAIAGHSYAVYGPLCNGTTSVIYEGAPGHPDAGRAWSIVERYKVSALYTTVTALQEQAAWRSRYPDRHDVSSLRVVGVRGEPVEPQAWTAWRDRLAGADCAIIDTWWQPENGMILITQLAGVSTPKPGSAGKPFPGVDTSLYDRRGRPVVAPGAPGHLVVRTPYPAMLRGLYNDAERYRRAYWERFPGVFFTGEMARVDADGDYWLLGRWGDE